jgi:flagellar motor switch protein FliN
VSAINQRLIKPDGHQLDTSMENKSDSNPPAEKIISEGRSAETALPSSDSRIGPGDGGGQKEGEKRTPSDTAGDGRSSGADKPETPRLGDGSNLDVILDIPLEITVELGRTKMPIRELLELGPGSAVPLSGLEGEPVDILANNKLIARGLVLVKDEKYGIRITEITGRLERLRGLR